MLINKKSEELSVRQQCQLLDLNRSMVYYHPRKPNAATLALMHLVDEVYTQYPFYGTRRMTAHLNRQGHCLNRKRLQRIYRLLSLEAIYPKPKTTLGNKQHKIYPYLLRDVKINHVHQVYSTDITYIRLKKGFVYLMAVIDWYSRYVLKWALSTSLDADFCIEALSELLTEGNRCEIFNTDQGCQFTSSGFTAQLKSHDIKISMDGKGRALDNIFVERLWRSVKYECIYLRELPDVKSAKDELERYFDFYNNERVHQSLDYRTPREVFFEGTIH